MTVFPLNRGVVVRVTQIGDECWVAASRYTSCTCLGKGYYFGWADFGVLWVCLACASSKGKVMFEFAKNFVLARRK